MNRRFLLVFVALSLVALGLARAAAADNSHARIVRLSLVQGDVRFASSFRDDPLTDANAGWQPAPLNLPIRQGFVLATDSGRAEIEFENGAMMFLSANTVVEFYDLSLQDGARISRLVLRQGTATVYVNPSNDDYFSLTGGDFTVEAAGRTRFRIDNFDDGSTVSVEQGRVNVLRDNKSTPLAKGESISAHASDPGNFVTDTAKDYDDFDRWVAGRIDSVATATAYSAQYVSSPGYSAGFADLYTYGSWFPMGGYGYCWRPFGVGLGWSPFAYGGWYMDASWGATFIGNAPWGWLPYHYGGWLFSPVFGWVWTPAGFGHGYWGGPIHYRPVTAVWVQNGGTTGLVPLHPGDKFGKTAQNLNHGIYSVQSSQIASNSMATEGKWSVLRQAPGAAVGSASRVSTLAPPARVSRTIVAGNSASSSRSVPLGRQSSISYDPVEHRYVNSGNPPATVTQPATEHTNVARVPGTQVVGNNPPAIGGQGNRGVPIGARPVTPNVPATSNSARISTPPRAPAAPAPARTSGAPSGGGYSTSGGSSAGRGATWGGSHPSSTGNGGSHPSGGGGSHPH
jgi:hypothetical protein